MITPRKVATFLLMCLLFSVSGLQMARAQSPGLTSTVLLTATANPNQPSIRLNWPVDPTATSYSIERIAVGDPGTPITLPAPTDAPASSNGYTDTTAAIGVAYQYKVYRGGSGGSGFIVSGINMPLPGSAQDGNRGTMILVVANDALADPRIALKVPRLVQDLTGDGWNVIQHNVPRDLDYNDAGVLVDKGAGIRNVKALIRADYNNVPTHDVKAVFLFGHVPIAYAGQEAPDSHRNHVGAWASDTYYSDMGPETNWTDSIVDVTTSGDKRNWNVPGDGKFDQSSGPNSPATTLEVGRVDLWNMPSFDNPVTNPNPKTEFDLLSQYLDKDHNYHQGYIIANPVGRICDVFGQGYDITGYSNFSPFFGPDAITISGQGSPSVLIPDLTGGSFLWTYGDGPGNPVSSGGVTTTSDFVLPANDPHSMFFMLFGSFLGDWGFSDDVMRAALCTPTYGLTCVWGSRPEWFFEHMGLGYEIGFSNRYTALANGNADWISLMGDPSLRQDIVSPASGLNAVASASDVKLTWAPSPQIGNYQPSPVIGYNLYRADSANGPYTLLNSSLVPGTSYTDTGMAGAAHFYQVRAIALQTSLSGTFYNQSEGAFQPYDNMHAAPTLTLVSPIKPPIGTVLLGATNNSQGVGFAATATSPAQFTIAADAASSIANDANLTISYYLNSKFIGSTNTIPYQQNVSVTPGLYTVSAVATDGVGATVSSQILPVYVFDVGEQLQVAGADTDASFQTIYNGGSLLTGWTDASVKTDGGGNTLMSDQFGAGDPKYQTSATVGVTLSAAGSSFILSHIPIDTTLTSGLTLVMYISGGKTGGQNITITAPLQDSTPSQSKVLTAGFQKVKFDLGSVVGSGGRQRSIDGFKITTTDGKAAPTFYIGNIQLIYHQVAPNSTPGVAVHLTNQPNVSATFTAGAPISFTGDAGTNNGSITEVDLFLVNGTATTYLGRAIGTSGDPNRPYSPFTFTLKSSLPTGTYQLRAAAVSSFGATNTTGPGHLYSPPSPDVTFNVANPPAVKITSPANDAGFTPSTAIPIMATATASTGANVTKVQFFESPDGGATTTQVGADQTTSPYGVTFTPTAVANYTLTAKVFDDAGGVTTSAAVTIHVGNPPTATITSPTDGSKFSSPTNFSPKVQAQEGTYTLTKLQIYNGSTLLYTQNFPFGSFPANTSITIFTEGFPALTAGTYALTAVVTDNYGISGTSPPVNITVVGPPTIAITSPANNATFTPSTAIPINATATASAGANITKVQFFQSFNSGTPTQIGTDQTGPSPYSVIFTPTASGTYTLTATVFDDAGSTATSLPITIRVGNAPTIAITSPANGAVFQAPATFTITATATPGSSPVTQVQFFSGNSATPFATGTANGNTYTFNDANVPAGTYTITAVATDSAGLTAKSAPVTITVGTPPSVAITTPADKAVFAAPATFTITATATPGSSPVTQVQFYSGASATPFATGAANGNVYTFSDPNVPAGTYTITAIATDSIGLTMRSAPVTITVGTPPSVAVTSPTNGAVFQAPATFAITAAATPGSNPITQVQFYANGAAIGAPVTTAPYTFNDPNVPAGTYTITAVATDSIGLTMTSAPVTITVGTPPSVAIIAPANKASFAAPATFTISATVAAGSSPVTQVQFYSGTSATPFATGTANGNVYTFSDPNVPAGTYIITAIVTDSAGLSMRSAPITVTVFTPQPIYGLVNRSYNNLPLTGAVISFTNTATNAVTSVTTGAAGAGPDGGSANYTLSSLVSGTYTATTTLAGYTSPAPQTIQVVSGTSQRVNFSFSALHTFPGGLQMFSIPYDYTTLGQSISSILDGLPSPKVVYWDPTTSYNPATTFALGTGYWAYFPTGANLTIQGTPAPSSQPFAITLKRGWNIIGDPFLASSPESAISVTGVDGTTNLLTIAVLKGQIGPNMYTYNQGAKTYDIHLLTGSTGSLDPYMGYWIYAYNSCTLSVTAPGGAVIPGAKKH